MVYHPIDTDNKTNHVVVNRTVQQIRIEKLRPFYRYHVSVMSITKWGFGVASQVLTAGTQYFARGKLSLRWLDLVYMFVARAWKPGSQSVKTLQLLLFHCLKATKRDK